MKYIAALAAIGCLAFAAPSASADDTVTPHAVQAIPLLNAEHVAKIKEEIRLQEARAREFEPIIARDRQARRDVETNWAVLERHARELHARAAEFRSFASSLTGKAQSDLNGFAGELDTFGTHDEENARTQHELAERLERTIKWEVETRDWHIKHAVRLKEWLAANGG